ncbi:MAG TPA: chorismate mutase [Terriglobales bacterium]|nr:chorismate mutase [Terriglobales bacterium]
MDIPGWRKQIDEIDRKLVELLNQRARAARAIGQLKQNTNLPIYEPERERTILDHVREVNRGPIANTDLVSVFEKIIGIMRRMQQDETAAGK